jgi:hypothetical protein
VVDAFLELGGLDTVDPDADAWSAGLGAEPEPFAVIEERGLDRVALA